MNKMTLYDYATLGPLLVLLFGALALILLESFASNLSSRISGLLTAGILLAAFGAELYAPQIENPLLTRWIRSDHLSHFFTIFFISTALATTLLSESFFKKFSASQGEYYFLLLTSTMGLIFIGQAADFLMLFIGIETLSLSLYILCCYMRHWDNTAEGALKYFLLGAIAAGFLLYGIALVYGAAGTTHFALLTEKYQAIARTQDQILFLSGMAFVTLGLAFKAALVPFHTWAPDVYESSPNPVTAFMAVGTKAGAFAAFIIIFLITLPQFDPRWQQAVAFLSIISMLYANFVALRQIQLRRFFAYSGISHAGFLLIPLAAGTVDAMNALLLYLVVYSLATMGSFAVLSYIDETKEGISLSNLKGLFHRSPFFAVVFALCLLTLAGIPPTAGFFAKFYLFKVAYDAKLFALIFVGLFTAILSAYYYLRIIALMFSKESQSAKQPESSTSLVCLTGFIFLALLILSIYPSFLEPIPLIGRAEFEIIFP